jgi:hypothetical protein
MLPPTSGELETEASWSSKMLVSYHITTQHHKPDDNVKDLVQIPNHFKRKKYHYNHKALKIFHDQRTVKFRESNSSVDLITL